MAQRFLDEESEGSHAARWDHFATELLETAEEKLGTDRRRDRDWFAENADKIRPLLKEKNDAHAASLRNPSSRYLRQRFAETRARTQTRLRELENNWWQGLAREIQGYADTNNMQMFYDATKRLYGP